MRAAWSLAAGVLVSLGCRAEGAESTSAWTEGGTSVGMSTIGPGTTGGDASAGSDDGPRPDAGDDGPPPPYGPARYPADAVHSPVTPFVADGWDAIAQADASLREDVFMKVGASSTVSPNTLACFATANVDLGRHQNLADALTYYLGGDAAGGSPFDRVSLAAESGQNAGWAISGDPAPIVAEAEAIDPRIALVHFGTNDMELGTSPATALPGFYDNMIALVTTLVDRGIVPVIFGITRRADDVGADQWVATYNAVLRGIAQTWQIPFVDQHNAMDPLPGDGLGADGIHLEAYDQGACLLTSDGLEHGYNMRNLVALQALDRTMAVLVDGAVELDPAVAPVPGEGSFEAPFLIDALPWADARDTSMLSDSFIDVYDGCDSTADESGPEVVYRLDLDGPTALRAVVLDGPGVDVDVHLLDETATGAGCIARDDRLIETTVDATGVYFVLDTYVDQGMAAAGDYLFVVVACDPGDPAC